MQNQLTDVPGPELVSVVIVNFNGETFLEGCLSSVFAQTYRPVEVIVVDNGSTDGSVRLVRSRFPEARLLVNTTNLGFAAGNNLGVREARGNIVALLNNDTLVQPGWLDGLLGALHHPGVAVAQSLILTDGIPREYYERNGSVNFLGHNIMRKFENPENVFFAGGASLIFRKDLFGVPFDDEYFAYGEDVYLSLRARFMGHRVKHTNASVLRHFGGLTTKRENPSSMVMLQERNRLLNTLLFFRGTTIVKLTPLLLGNVMAKVVAGALGHRYSLPGIVRAYWWLIMHAGAIRLKRRLLRKDFRVDEREVISWMTADLTNGKGIGKAINAVSRAYCRMVGLKTMEYAPAGSR